VQICTGFLRQKSYKIQGFSRPFHSIIQGQFNALLPVNHSIAYSPTDTQEKRKDLKHWCVIFISKMVWAVLLPALQQLWQFIQSPSLVETFMMNRFQTFQGLPFFFQNNWRPFSVFWNSRTFQGWPWIQGRHSNPVCRYCTLYSTYILPQYSSQAGTRPVFLNLPNPYLYSSACQSTF